MSDYSGSSIDGADAAVPLALQTEITDRLQTSTEVDYFKIKSDYISVDSLITLDFGVTQASSNNEYIISIVNHANIAGAELVTTTTGQDAILTYQASAGISYYVKVEKGVEGYNGDYYTLNVAINGTSEIEGNGTQVNANALLENVDYTGNLATTADVDVFAFTTGPAFGTVLLSVGAASTASTIFYDIDITNDAGEPVKDSNGDFVATTVGGSSDGTISFGVTDSSGQTPQGTYFLTIKNNDAATTPDTKYTINLAGTSALSSVAQTHDYNNAPSVTMGSMTSAAYGSTKASDEILSVNMDSFVNLSDIISASDADSSSTTNGTIKSYIVALVDDDATPVTYSGSELIYDGYISFGSTPTYVSGSASAQGESVYFSIDAADFATAKYYAGTSTNTQTLYVAAVDSSGASSLSNNPLPSLDTSGFVTMALASSDASISVVAAEVGTTAGSTALKEGNTSATYSETLTISVSSVTKPSDESVVVVLDPGDDLAISGSTLTPSNAVTLNVANSYSATVTVVAKSDAITELSHTGALSFTTTSANDSAFNNLSIEGLSYTITEQVANFSVGDVTYSSGTSVLEGAASRTGSYTITATDIPEATTLNVSVTGTGLDVTSSTSLAFTYDSGNSVTQTVTFIAEDDVIEEASPHTGTLTHTVVDSDGDPLSQYNGAVADASASITDMVDAIKTFDAQITTSSTQGITGLDVELWADSASSAAATYGATNGEITVPTSQTFAQVKLSVAAAYNMADAIDISDILLAVKDIIGVSSLTGNAQHAADVNNDASVDISDVLLMVKHVINIAPIDHFDLIDSNGALVTDLAPLSAGDAPQYQLVMNGDVNIDGVFTDNYVGPLDIT